MKNLSIFKKVFLSLLILVLFISTLFAYFSYKGAREKLENYLGERLSTIVKTAVHSLSVDDHNELLAAYLSEEKELGKSPFYKKINESLEKVKVSNELETNLYTLVQLPWAPEKMVFISMSGDLNYTGNTLALSDVVKRAYETKKAQYSKLYKDKEGEWVSGVAPLIDEENKVIAVLEADYNASTEVRAFEEKILKEVLILSALLIAVSILFSFFLGQLITRPIKVFTRKVSLYDKENLSMRFDEDSFGGEIQIMAKTFNELIGELDSYTVNLESIIEERTSEIKKLQFKLLRNAYQEGQAESSVHVLHHIGNTLTPLISKVSENKGLSELKKITTVLEKIIDKGDLAKKGPSEIEGFLKTLLSENEKMISQLSGDHERIKKGIEVISSQVSAHENIVEKRKVEKQEMDLLASLKDVLRYYEKELSEGNILVELNGRSGIFVSCEEGKLAQVLMTLVQNAIDSMLSFCGGQRRLTISLNQQGGRVVIDMSDNGAGLKEEDQGLVFNSGFSTKGRTPHFGLHNCMNYMRTLDGSIDFQSEGEEKGASLKLTFPST